MPAPILERALAGDEQAVDVEKAAMRVATEAELAQRLQASGRRVVLRSNRYWQQTNPGFFRPVNLFARLTAREVTRPTPMSWGFHACLAEEDAWYANAAAPAYVVSDLASFDDDQLRSSRRYKLRKARKLSRLVQLTGPDLLREQGYEVLRSAHERNAYGRLPSREKYLEGIEPLTDPSQGVVLAGLVDGKLGGYITGYAVEGTAYVADVVIATEALGTHVSTGLTYEFIQLCSRTPDVHELVHGWHIPENQGLCRYKDWLGLSVSRVPVRLNLPPGAGSLIRRRNPGKYYRLTGRD